MSDLQTEIFTKVLPKMQKLNNLTFDDDANAPVEIALEEPTNNITEQIWRFIRDNPSCTVKEIAKTLSNDKGVSTRINQLRTRGYIVTDYTVFPHTHKVDKEYTGVSQEERTARMMAARAVWAKNQANKVTQVKKKVGRPLGSTKAAAEPVAKPSRVVDLNNLSIVEARKLYDELKQIFGG